MPKGENKEFQERVGVLSQRLKRLNIERRIEARYPSVPLDKLDLEAYITEDETFPEIWDSIEHQIKMLSEDQFENMTKEEIENEIEKYEVLREEKKQEVKIRR